MSLSSISPHADRQFDSLQSVASLVFSIADASPDRLAIVSEDQQITFSKLKDYTLALVSAFTKFGVNSKYII